MKKTTIILSSIIAILLTTSIVWAANTFPTTLNVWEEGDIIEEDWGNALEDKIGVDDSTVTSSIDYLIKSATSSLGSIYNITHSDGKFIVSNGTIFVAESGATARTSLGLGSMALLSSIDISSNTNLTVNGTLLDLTDDTLSINEGTLTDAKFCIYTSGTGIVCNSEGGATLFTDGGAFTYLTSTTDDIVFGAASTTGYAFLFDVSTGDLVTTGALTVPGTSTLATTSVTHLGIGTTTADGLVSLTVIGPVEIRHKVGEARHHLLSYSGNDGFHNIYDDSGNIDIQLFADNNSYFMNSIGIGTTTPSQALTVGVANNFTVDSSGNVVIAGTLGVTGTSTLATTTISAISADLIPDGNKTRDLGSSGSQWANVYVDDILFDSGGEIMGWSAEMAVDKDWLPKTTATHDLGSSSYIWAEGYISKLYLDADSTIEAADVDAWITTVAYGDLTGNPSDVITAGTNISWSTDTLNVDDVFIKLLGDVTGSLTSDLNIDANTLVVSYNDNKVGIGTASPNAPLEVKGIKPGIVGGFQSGMFQVTDAEDAEFSNSVITGHSAYNTNTQLWYLGSLSSSNNDIGFLNRQNAAIHFYTNNAFRMAIDATGNVGIGTTSPSQLLTVGNNNQFTVTSAGAIDATSLTLDTALADAEVSNTLTASIVSDADKGDVNITGGVWQTQDLTIASEATGDLLYFDGTNWVRLATGTDAYVLTMSSDVPTWVVAAGGGDVTAVGDCAAGLCFDGTSDGGTYLDFYDAQGRTRLIGGNTTALTDITLPNATGTLALTSVATLSSLTSIGTIGTGVWQGDPIVDAYIANALTIVGGTIDASAVDGTPIGASTSSTGVFTNATTTNLVVVTGLTIPDNSVDEADISFSTACAAGNHYYLSGNNLACEADDDTTYLGGTNLTLDSVTFNVDDAFLVNNAADIGVGLTLTGDNSATGTQYTAQVFYDTTSTPPAASGFPIGTIYIQYTE